MALLKATCLFELTVELMVNNTSCGLVCDYIWFLPWLYFLLYKLPFGLLLQIHCTVWVFKALFVKPCDFSTCLVQSSHWFKREEEFVLMAVVQSWSRHRFQFQKSAVTHTLLCMRIRAGKGETAQKLEEKSRLWYWIKPSHFLYPEPALFSTSHIW